jgi:hypothetical protein
VDDRACRVWVRRSVGVRAARCSLMMSGTASGQYKGSDDDDGRDDGTSFHNL